MEVSDRLRLWFYGPEMINVESEPVWREDYDDLPFLCNQMIQILEQNRAVGIAAPQVGVFKQVIIVQLEDESRLNLVNPEITRMYGKEIEGFEACLSLPPGGNECLVPRLEYIDIEAASVEYPDVKRPYKFQRTSARVVQHELDHLTGTFFIDRVSEKRKRPVIEKFEIWKRSRGDKNATRSRTPIGTERYLSQVRFRS